MDKEIKIAKVDPIRKNLFADLLINKINKKKTIETMRIIPHVISHLNNDFFCCVYS